MTVTILQSADSRMVVNKAGQVRPDEPVTLLTAPGRVAGDPELPGFTLDLAKVWQPDF
ncbi:MAG: hypothetical protein ACH37Z_13545 [Anaerolineae bacterium]|nr:hypothetical protein [Ardenticatenia bacterium]